MDISTWTISGVIHTFNPFFRFVMKLLAWKGLVVSWSIMSVAAVGNAGDATAVCTKIAQTISSASQVFYPGDLKNLLGSSIADVQLCRRSSIWEGDFSCCHIEYSAIQMCSWSGDSRRRGQNCRIVVPLFPSILAYSFGVCFISLSSWGAQRHRLR